MKRSYLIAIIIMGALLVALIIFYRAQLFLSFNHFFVEPKIEEFAEEIRENNKKLYEEQWNNVINKAVTIQLPKNNRSLKTFKVDMLGYATFSYDATERFSLTIGNQIVLDKYNIIENGASIDDWSLILNNKEVATINFNDGRDWNKYGSNNDTEPIYYLLNDYVVEDKNISGTTMGILTARKQTSYETKRGTFLEEYIEVSYGNEGRDRNSRDLVNDAYFENKEEALHFLDSITQSFTIENPDPLVHYLDDFGFNL